MAQHVTVRKAAKIAKAAREAMYLREGTQVRRGGHRSCLGRASAIRARHGFTERFEREVDPDRVLDPEERARRAKAAQSAWMKRLSHLSQEARKRYKEDPGSNRGRPVTEKDKERRDKRLQRKAQMLHSLRG